METSSAELGTRLRHVLELLGGDVAKVYVDLYLDDYRPRFSPIVRALVAGADARQRIVQLTGKARSLLPTIEAEWAATQAAADELEAELPFPLSDVLAATVSVLERRLFRQRIAEAAPLVPD